ncbi:hypothetical protein [Kitasatospora sp. NBC_01266]|uniref:hypothetical protein n=1 Tax=Kitasatospora sp. NBC_01266 TaxID=2903572 RepID=UPI002E34C94B|nr:hypothetical protein [Kitasatospora sp. NBC_01266]
MREALEDAAAQDPGFAEALDRAVEELRARSRTTGGESAGDDGAAGGGNVGIRCGYPFAVGWDGPVVSLDPAFQRGLGPDHPDTLATWHSLAYWREEAGR